MNFVRAVFQNPACLANITKTPTTTTTTTRQHTTNLNQQSYYLFGNGDSTTDNMHTFHLHDDDNVSNSSGGNNRNVDGSSGGINGTSNGIDALLPTPEDLARRSVCDSSIIPVDTSGFAFNRICQYRASLRAASLDSLDCRPKSENFPVVTTDPMPIQRCRNLEFEQCRSSGYKTDDDDISFRISRSRDTLDTDYIGNYSLFERSGSTSALARLRGSLRHLSCLSSRDRESRSATRNRDEMKFRSRSMPNVADQDDVFIESFKKQKPMKVASEEILDSPQPSCMRFNKLRRSRSQSSKKHDGPRILQRYKSQDIKQQEFELTNIDINDQDEGIQVSRDDLSQSEDGKKGKRKSMTSRLSQMWTDVKLRGFKVTRKPGDRNSSSG